MRERAAVNFETPCDCVSSDKREEIGAREKRNAVVATVAPPLLVESECALLH